MAEMTVGAWLALGSTAVSAASAWESSRKQKQASKDAKESELVARNEQKSQDTINRRAQIREERIRRAQIMQEAQNSGAAGSSGAAGATSSLSATIGANLSGISRGAATADNMSYLQASAQKNIDSANASLAVGDTIKSWLDGAGSAYSTYQDNASKTQPTTGPTSGTNGGGMEMDYSWIGKKD